MSDEPKKNKGGRPRKHVDKELVKKLSSIQCSLRDLEEILGVSRQTILNHAGEEYKLGKAEGRASLRRRQWEAAMSGSVPMLIWLGKNILGQRDQPIDEEEKNMILPWEEGEKDDTDTK